MEKKIVFVKIDKWLKDFYNLPDEMPLFEEDWKRIEETNLAYDFQAGFEATNYWIKQPTPKSAELLQQLEIFTQKWPLMLHLNNLMEEENFTRAQETLIAMKKIDPYDPSVYFHLGYVQKRLGKISESIENYLKCIELYPDFLAAYTNLARTYTEIGDRDNAIKYLRKALEIQPGDIYILEELAELKEVFPVFTEPGNYDSLVYIEKDAYQKSIEKEIEKLEKPQELFNLANILLQDTLYSSALKAINRYLELEKNNPLTGWILKAELLRLNAELEQSERLLEEISEQYPDLPPHYYFVKAKLLIQKEKITEAFEELSVMIEKDPNFLEGLQLYYFLLRELHSEPELIEELENITRDFPDSWVALYLLGVHYALTNRLEEAETYFLKTLDKNPYAENAILDLSGIYGRRGLHEKIIWLLEPYFEKDSLKIPSVLWNLANAYKATQQFSKAEEVYQRMLKLPHLSPIYIQNAKNEIEQLKRFSPSQ